MDSHNLAQRITAANPNVSNPERWLSVVAGAAIATYGLTRRNISGIVLAAVGSGLVWRGASGHCSVYESLGISTASDGSATNDDHVSVPYGRGIRVEETVTIDAPADRLFAFWRNFENLPRFMEHLKSVTVIDDKRSHWVAKGPAGSDAEWDAVIINEVPNELIGWRSVDGSQVDNAGSVHFSSAANGRGTIVKVVLRYDPPAGKVGAAIAKLFGEDPAHQVTEELRTFKQLMETGIAA
ncbi:MAG: cyclase/dehydrase [Acidobacteria bacterium]|nr:cyclase/dehydrase [Acidobacteriota bacterium]